MLHAKKPVYFHFMEYQLPIPLIKKWGRRLWPDWKLWKLSDVLQIVASTQAAPCTTWLGFLWNVPRQPEENFWGQKKSSVALESSVSSIETEEWKCVVMGIREEIVEMSKSRATSLREAWGHSNVPAKLCLCLLWWLPASAVGLPGLPLLAVGVTSAGPRMPDS